MKKKFSSNSYAIRLDNVDTIYEGERIPAIKDINLKIKRKKFICIIGPNGTGKTTLLETINGILSPTRGKVHIFGQDIKKFKYYIRKEIGYVPQEVAVDELCPFLVEDVVVMGRFGKIGILKSPTSSDFEIVEQTMSWIGIKDLAKKPIGKLSGGQLQKVMIARALAKKPKILLLDEPFSSLDVKASQDISKKICELQADFDLTVIMVTHNIGSIPKSCNKVMLMSNGKIVQDNLSREILHLDRIKLLYGMNS